jgi:hypothetical protein
MVKYFTVWFGSAYIMFVESGYNGNDFNLQIKFRLEDDTLNSMARLAEGWLPWRIQNESNRNLMSIG